MASSSHGLLKSTLVHGLKGREGNDRSRSRTGKCDEPNIDLL